MPTTTTTVHLDEHEIKNILKKHIESLGYKVKEYTLSVRGREGDTQIPKGAIGDQAGFEATVEKNKQNDE